jgi:bifunctional DNA-binding transcriptional regulator/antitoxin component of YhaV-PrlF toxin-antitoxin module
MRPKLEFQIEKDDRGRLVLPPEVGSRHGLKPGSKIYLENNGDGFLSALVINERVKSVGRVPTKEQIKKWLLEESAGK